MNREILMRNVHILCLYFNIYFNILYLSNISRKVFYIILLVKSNISVFSGKAVRV